jgi:hypothetical protein
LYRNRLAQAQLPWYRDPRARTVTCPDPLCNANRVLASATADVDADGRAEAIAVVMRGGEYIVDQEPDFRCSPRVAGEIVLRVSPQRGLPIETALGWRALCEGPWGLEIADYNHDGHVDFNLGFPENSSNSFYSLFTIGADGRTTPLNVRYADDPTPTTFITAETTGNSTDAIDITPTGFRVAAFSPGSWWVIEFTWNAREGLFEETARNAVAEAPAFSTSHRP